MDPYDNSLKLFKWHFKFCKFLREADDVGGAHLGRGSQRKLWSLVLESKDIADCSASSSHYSVYPDAETWVVKIFHVCQPTELSWRDKDTYMVTVFWWQCSRKPKVWFFLIAQLGKYMWGCLFVCLFSITEDAKSQFKSTKKLTRLGHCEAK